MGDRILFRENNRDLGVMNGLFGTLKRVKNGRFHVALDNGNNVAFSPQEYSHFQLGYAATVHKSQGVTVDETYVLASPHFDRHTTYVAMSRHKQAVKLYASKGDFRKADRLYTQLGKDGEKLSTLDFTDTRQKQHTSEREVQARPSFFQRLWRYVAREQEKPVPEQKTPDPLQNHSQFSAHTLSQQEFVKLRDEFIQRTNSEKKQSFEKENQQHHSPRLER